MVTAAATIIAAAVVIFIIDVESMILPTRRRIVDAHVHVWGDGSPPHPYIKLPPPPTELVVEGSPARLLSLMDASSVDYAVVIQPIQYLYDHRYLTDEVMIVPEYNRRLKFMALMDPTLEDTAYGECFLEGLYRRGFVGVRFNPALFPNNEGMSDDKGVAWFRKCGELKMVVGIMCFKGLSRHYDDVVSLLTKGSESTNVIIDHFGFFLQDGAVDETSFTQLLSLARFPNVHVKISGLFRVSTQPFPHKDLDIRLMQLVDAFGSQRLLFGTDFPFVMQQQSNKPYHAYVHDAISSWERTATTMTPTQLDDLFFCTAERLFGPF